MIYCPVHEIVVCIECNIEQHQACGKVKSLKKGAEEQQQRLEEIRD